MSGRSYEGSKFGIGYVFSVNGFGQKLLRPAIAQDSEVVESKPIVLTGKELGDFDTSTSEGKKAMRSALKEHLMAMRGDFVDCPVFGDKIMIDKSGIKETLAFTGNPIKMQALYSIKDLIRTAKSVAEEPNFKKSDKPDVIGYLRLKNSIQINGVHKMLILR